MPNAVLNPCLALLVAAAPVVAQPGPPGPAGRGPGYYRTFPSDAGKAVLRDLSGTESDRFSDILGPGPWTLGGLEPPVPYVIGPSEKDVIRLGSMMIKGPHVTLESPFCQWNVPCETDGDVAWIHRWATGEDHEEVKGEMSASLRRSLRGYRCYGGVTRGLRAALVPAAEAVEVGRPLRVTLTAYNASGKAIDVTASTATVRFGKAHAVVPFGQPGREPGQFVFRPGQGYSRDLKFEELDWTVGKREVEFRTLAVPGTDPGTELTVSVAIQLAPDARGRAGVVSSEPATLRVKPAAKGRAKKR